MCIQEQGGRGEPCSWPFNLWVNMFCNTVVEALSAGKGCSFSPGRRNFPRPTILPLLSRDRDHRDRSLKVEEMEAEGRSGWLSDRAEGASQEGDRSNYILFIRGNCIQQEVRFPVFFSTSDFIPFFEGGKKIKEEDIRKQLFKISWKWIITTDKRSV